MGNQGDQESGTVRPHFELWDGVLIFFEVVVFAAKAGASYVQALG